MDNKYTRAMGFFPPSWGGHGVTTNHFTAGGGLNLRGYSGYLMPEVNPDGRISYHYKGTTGAAFNMELEFGEVFSFLSPTRLRQSVRLQPYLFADAGIIHINRPGDPYKMSELIADAGAGVSLSILRWWKLYNVKPLTVRFDMPFFLNRLPFAEDDYVQFRWMIGVNREF
jgi:aminopeptidase N